MELEIENLRSLVEVLNYSSKSVNTEYYTKLLQAIQCKILLELKDSKIDYESYYRDQQAIKKQLLPAIVLTVLNQNWKKISSDNFKMKEYIKLFGATFTGLIATKVMYNTFIHRNYISPIVEPKLISKDGKSMVSADGSIKNWKKIIHLID